MELVLLLYLAIGFILAVIYAKTGTGDGGKCIGMVWAWPLILFIGILVIWPGEYFDKMCRNARLKKELKEQEKKDKRMHENCKKCTWDNVICTHIEKPWSTDCYEKPKVMVEEGNKNETN